MESTTLNVLCHFNKTTILVTQMKCHQSVVSANSGQNQRILYLAMRHHIHTDTDAISVHYHTYQRTA